MLTMILFKSAKRGLDGIFRTLLGGDLQSIDQFPPVLFPAFYLTTCSREPYLVIFLNAGDEFFLERGEASYQSKSRITGRTHRDKGT